jgi:uncharacterized membrane protein YgdD (TMEM256/DUF423 family)
MYKSGFIAAAVCGATAVILGAFGAHALKELLGPGDLAVWKTAVEYQFYHTFAILAVVLSSNFIGERRATIISRIFIAGIILFSGSLYILATHEITGFRWALLLGPVTPFGGLFFITGWLAFGISAYKISKK